MLTFQKGASVLVCQHDVLDWNTHYKLLEYVASCESEYVPATVSTDMADARHARVLFRTDGPPQLIRQLVHEILPDIWPIFQEQGIGARPETIELQVTAHGPDDYFRVHNDNGSPDSANRVVTFVYYLGRHYLDTGALRLYETRKDGSRGHPEFDLFPQPNSLVFFTSSTWHEVLPVRPASNQFSDARFTVNGWFRR